ncbi:hypothetical protein MTR67_009372, partial [Solanum verrucosum]
IWASEVNYEGYKSDEIVVGQSISFLNLKAAISAELEIDEQKHKVPMVPMPDKEDWSFPSNVIDETVWPPRYKRLAGRPRKRRKKTADEKRTVNINCCGRCGQEGHNKRTCTFFPKEK